MRRLVILFALILVGCSQPVPAPLPEKAPLTPESSGIWFQPRIDEAVLGGEVWLDTKDVPPDGLHTWYVGLTDGAGREHRLGWLTEAPNYKVPRVATPGVGEVWISTTESASSPGTLRAKMNLLVAYDRYESQAMGLSFAVPAAWRLHESQDLILLERTAERASTPIEGIWITPCDPAQGCPAVEGEVQEESERWIAGRWTPYRHLRRSTKNQTATWEEMHLLFPRADLTLSYRPPMAFDLQQLYQSLAESLRFPGEELPEEVRTACEALLAEVHPAIGPDWTLGYEGDCSRHWHDPASPVDLSLSKMPPNPRALIETRSVTLAGAAGPYPAVLGQMLARQVGIDPPPLPNFWVLQVAGARGEVMLTCSLNYGTKDRSELPALQAKVEQYCTPLLLATKIGNLGEPKAPPQR